MDREHGYLRQGTPGGRARGFGLLLGVLALAAVTAAAGVAILVVWPDSATRSAAPATGHHVVNAAPRTPAFVGAQLGARRPGLHAVARQSERASSAVTPGGFRVSVAGGSVALSSLDGRGGAWTSYDGGAARSAPYGREFVTVGSSGAEQLLQVDRLQGTHTWRWKLDTAGMIPQLRGDGSVALVGATGKDTGLRIAPVQLLDAHGAKITPKKLRWTLDGRYLELRLDDAGLPLPYLIDPAVATPISFAGTSMVAGATADWTVGFTTSASGALATGNQIIVTFPNSANHLNFVSPATPTIALVSGFVNCSATATGGANIVTITLANSGGACAVGNSTAVSLTIQGLTNPTHGAAATINKNLFTISTTKDTVNNWAASGAGTVSFTVGPAVKLLMVLTGQVADPGAAPGSTA